MSSIEWTDEVWNPVVGCSRVSAGCEHCYAERVAHRGLTETHRGLTVVGKKGPRWNGTVRTLPERLATPLRWRKPRRVFVNSMSDLFHEAVPFEFIAAVFGVMAACPQHTFQVLTKRDPRPFFEWLRGEGEGCASLHVGGSPLTVACVIEAQRQDHRFLEEIPRNGLGRVQSKSDPWPLPNVWLGVSVEDQQTADQRIPWLLECPAAVRWVSYEPALEGVDFGDYLPPITDDWCAAHGGPRACDCAPTLDWIVVGGESGPGARPFDLGWARSTIAQCDAAGVPVFVKQLGSRPVKTVREGLPPRPLVEIQSGKGNDPTEWPEDLRRRDFPEGSDVG